MNGNNRNKYWLIDDAEVVASELMELHDKWVSLGDNPVMRAWYRNQASYYSPIIDAGYWESSLDFVGEQGELIKMSVPMARQAIRQTTTIITKQNLDFQPVMTMAGADIRNLNRIARDYCQQVVKDQKMDKKGENLVELGLVQGAAYIKTVWRTDKGRPYEQEENPYAKGVKGVALEGDIDMGVYGVYDVIFDYTIEDFHERNWIEVRTKKNRWTLIAQYPELRDEIMAIPSVSQSSRGNYDRQFMGSFVEDLIYVFEVYVRPDAALPEGRMMFYASDRCVFFDGPNIYGTIPVAEFKPEHVFGIGFGYPQLSNLLPIQEMLDHTMSAIATNQTLSIQNVTVSRQSNISVDQIGGMNWIFYNADERGGGKPEPLNLTQTSPDTFKFMDVLTNKMSELSNLNAALRGQQVPGVTSGAAYATLTANALQFVDSAAKSYVETMKESMLHAVNAVRRFGGKTQRYIRSVNYANGQQTDQPFVGKDFDPIQYIELQVVNPLMSTLSGRLEIAKELTTNGFVKNADEYLSIMEGQPLRKLTKDSMSESDLIENENEELQQGREVPALATDDHAEHIRCHNTLLNNAEIRRNGKMVQMILGHMDEHLQLSKNTDPYLQAMVRTGTMPEGGPPPPPMMGPGPGGPGGPGGPAQGGGPGEGPSGPSKNGMPAIEAAKPAKDLLERGI